MNEIKNILIKGVGLVPAMAAAYLGRMLPSQYYHVSCYSDASDLESEIHLATLHPDTREFNRLLKIKEVDFLRSCDGVFSLGDKITDEIGHDYLNTFCPYGLSIGGVSFRSALQKLGAFEKLSDWEDCNLAARMARKGKFLPPDPQGRPVIGDYTYGYQVNPASYRELLLKQAMAFGVLINPISEFIPERHSEAFFIIDCEKSHFWDTDLAPESSEMFNHVRHHITGEYVTTQINFQKTQYEMSINADEFVPAIPKDGGRLWRENTLYLSYMPRLLPFLGTPSRLIQISLHHLLSLFPSGETMGAERAEFNSIMGEIISRFADFQSILLASSSFKAQSFESLSDEAQFKLRVFSARGRLSVLDGDTLLQDQWISMLLGQGIWPNGLNLISKGLSDNQIDAFRKDYGDIVDQALRQMPDTVDFIQNTCPALGSYESRRNVD
ncbi:tryptophan 7-halogenase [Litorimonas haliclonae]|uniref:tryptophan 7-halogenase n=1 Tax=Litorimonas haliclonae TaxID=2081977 RepID=UPI0039EF3B9A